MQVRDDSGRLRYLAFLALVIIAAMWGYNWVVAKIALQYSEPFAFSALRMFLSALSLFAVMVALKRPLRPKALFLTAVVGLLQTGCFGTLAVWALKYGGVGKTSTLVYVMPFWLLLLAWIILGERLGYLQWLTIVPAFCGLILILEPWEFRGGIIGDAMAIAAGLSWAASAVVAKVLNARHKVDLLSLTAWQMLLGSIPLVIIAAITTGESTVWSGSFIATLIYNIVSNALGWYLWLFVVKVIPAGVAGIGTLAVPVIGIASAQLQLGERPAIWEGTGMLLIIAALAILTGLTYVKGRQPIGHS